jgi:hypothetical protein
VGWQKTRYNQIGNFVLTQTEINIAIGDQSPKQYFQRVVEQCNGGTLRYGGISDLKELRANLRSNCIPVGFDCIPDEDYDRFLDARRSMMSAKLKEYYFSL